MRHYEIVIMIHPDQSEQVPAMIERYVDLVVKNNGKVHRIENWGRRNLEYPINKIYKATYVLMNVECSFDVINQLENNFRYNDAVLRSLVLRVDEAITTPSPLAKAEESVKVSEE